MNKQQPNFFSNPANFSARPSNAMSPSMSAQYLGAGTTNTSRNHHHQMNPSQNYNAASLKQSPSYGAILSPMTPNRKIGNAHLERHSLNPATNNYMSTSTLGLNNQHKNNIAATRQNNSQMRPSSANRINEVAENPVRYLHHQNNERVKAESEMINRFEKSHGRNVEMAVPSTTSTHQ